MVVVVARVVPEARWLACELRRGVCGPVCAGLAVGMSRTGYVVRRSCVLALCGEMVVCALA